MKVDRPGGIGRIDDIGIRLIIVPIGSACSRRAPLVRRFDSVGAVAAHVS